MKALINIITRFSKKEIFTKTHYPSIQSQTYRNFNHIITFTNDEEKQFLLENTNPDTTTLCRCFPTKAIPNMGRSFYYKQWGPYNNLESLDYKQWEGEFKELTNPNWEGGRFATKHFPYNLYMLKAEQKVKKGWIMYLDDDDWLYNKTSLERLLPSLINKDTLVGFNQKCQKEIRPQEYAVNHVYSQNIPPALGVGFNGSTQTFHSDYLEYTNWDEWGGGDFNTLRSLWNNIPYKSFLPEIIVECSPPNPK